MDAFYQFLILAIVIAAPIALVVTAVIFGRLGTLTSRLGNVEWALSAVTIEKETQRFDVRAAAAAPSTAAPATTPASQFPIPNAFERPAVATPPAVVETPTAKPSEPESASNSAPAPTPAPSAPRPERNGGPTFDWELFAGGRFFNIVGAIVLVIGVGLLMKYAFDNNWITAPLRVLAGVIVGAVAIGFGAFTHGKQKDRGRAWFSEGVFGAGLGTLYVTGYTSFQSYHLVSFALAFGFMSIVTVVAFAIALRYDSLPMALIGWAGGFITPFAMGLANTNEGGLAAYILFLDAGLAAVALARRRWFALSPLALVASYAIAVAWYLSHATAASYTVSTCALFGLWAVFFGSGVTNALRESKMDSSAMTLLRAGADVVNAAALWLSLGVVLAVNQTAFAEVQAVASLGYAGAYAMVLKRSNDRRGLRVQYLVGVASFLAGAIVAYVPVQNLALAFGGLAMFAAIVASRIRDPRADVARECAFLTFGFFAIAGASLFALPDARIEAPSGWKFAIGSRDFAFAFFAAVGFALDRLLRRVLPSDAPGIVLRQISVIATLALEAFHYRGYELSAAFVATGLAISFGDAALRRFGRSYAPNAEPVIASFALIVLGANAWLATPEATRAAYGVLDLHWGSRDIAIGFFAIASFAMDRVWRSIPSAAPCALGFRICAVLGAVTLEALHARGLGLVTMLAFSSIALVAFDRTLRSVVSAYASPREVASTAGVLLAIAWYALIGVVNQFAYARGLFVGFGKVDSTLGVLVASLWVFTRVARPSLPGFVSIVARQSMLVAIVLATVAHASGLTLWASIAVEALAYGILGTRRMLRDLEIDGIVLLALALCFTLAQPAAWQAQQLASFIPFLDERARALGTVAACAILLSECYRRRSLLGGWVWRTSRLAGVGTIVIALTGEFRDTFERAILVVGPAVPGAIAQIRDQEGLAVSALWLVASVVVIGIGIVLKIKDFRIAAIALFDMTILKAFFVDLGALAPPYRILSFIGLGLTLLAVSYVYQRLERGRPPGPTLESEASVAA